MTTTPKSDIEILLERSNEIREASTKVNAWYPYSTGDHNYSEATVRGPFHRWFKVEEVAPEYKKHVAPGVDDARFAAHSMNTSALKDQMIRTLSGALAKFSSEDFYIDHSKTRVINGTKVFTMKDCIQLQKEAQTALTEASRLAREAMEKL